MCVAVSLLQYTLEMAVEDGVEGADQEKIQHELWMHPFVTAVDRLSQMIENPVSTLSGLSLASLSLSLSLSLSPLLATSVIRDPGSLTHGNPSPTGIPLGDDLFRPKYPSPTSSTALTRTRGDA